MKTMLRISTVLVCLFFITSAFAQNAFQPVHKSFPGAMTPAKKQGTADRVSAGPSHSKEQLNAYVPYDPINPVVSVAGATYMNVGSMFDLQTNGRGLHNIIFDPSDAMKVHACMMVTTSNDPSDTATFDSRRIVYVL